MKKKDMRKPKKMSEKEAKILSDEFLEWIYQHETGSEEVEIAACMYTAYRIMKDSIRNKDGSKLTQSELIDSFLELSVITPLIDKDINLEDYPDETSNENMFQ